MAHLLPRESAYNRNSRRACSTCSAVDAGTMDMFGLALVLSGEAILQS
jgi:hypothetical protein